MSVFAVLIGAGYYLLASPSWAWPLLLGCSTVLAPWFLAGAIVSLLLALSLVYLVVQMKGKSQESMPEPVSQVSSPRRAETLQASIASAPAPVHARRIVVEEEGLRNSQQIPAAA